jgi:hypothetical protein
MPNCFENKSILQSRVSAIQVDERNKAVIGPDGNTSVTGSCSRAKPKGNQKKDTGYSRQPGLPSQGVQSTCTYLDLDDTSSFEKKRKEKKRKEEKRNRS